MNGPEDNPRDDEQPKKEEYEAWEREQLIEEASPDEGMQRPL